MQEEIQIVNEVALSVLIAIDKLVKWQRETSAKYEKGLMRLAALLVEAKRGAYWTLRGYKSEEEYIRDIFPQSRANYYALIGIGEHLANYPRELLENLGRSKCEDLVRVQRHCGLIPENWFLHAQEDDKDTFRRRVRSFLTDDTGDGSKSQPKPDPKVEDHFISFRIFGDDIITINRTFETMTKLVGSDRGLGFLFVLVCANFLSQFAEDGSGHVMGKNQFILTTIKGFVEQLDFSEAQVVDRLIGTIAAGVDKNRGTPMETKETEAKSESVPSAKTETV
jgi:hypothetical protein